MLLLRVTAQKVGRCLWPDAQCWRDGRRLLIAALNANATTSRLAGTGPGSGAVLVNGLDVTVPPQTA
jgi:hypothetical protein